MKSSRKRKTSRPKRSNSLIPGILCFLLFAAGSGNAEDKAPQTETILELADRETGIEKAISILEQGLKTETKKERRYEILTRLGPLYELKGDVESAQRSFELAAFVRDAVKDFEAFYRSALLLLSMGQSERAVSQLKTLLLASKDAALNRKAELLLLYSYASNRQDKDFDALYREARIEANLQTYSSSELYILYQALVRGRNKNEAEAVKSELGKRFPKSPETALLGPEGENGPIGIYPEPSLFLSEAPQPGESQVDPNRVEPQIQVGLFSREANARQLEHALVEKKFDASVVPVARDGNAYFKVVVRLKNEAERHDVLLRLKDAGFEAF